MNTAVVLALCALLLFSGCKKKKPNLPPPQAQAPTITTPPVQEPPAQTTTQQNPPATDTQPTATNTPPTTKTPPKHPRPHNPPVAKKPPNGTEKPPQEVAKNTPPPRITIQDGGTNAPPGQISPGLNDEATHNQASADQLLASTETNLKNIKRQLSTDEQSIVTQIRDYMAQSRQATKDGDSVRARNLALKAHLLSDELVKPK